MKISKDKIETIIGNYKAGDAKIINPEIVQKVKEYKRKVASRFIALGKDDIKKRIIGESFNISKKIDGEFHVLFYEQDNAFLAKPGGLVLYGLPCIEEAQSILKKSGLKSGVFAGELYLRKKDNSRSRVFDIISAARNPKDENELKNICFAPFDILEINDKVFVTENVEEISNKLNEIFSNTKLCTPVESAIGKSADEIENLYNKWVEKEGHEGLVVKSNQPFVYKIKPQHNIDVAIIGYAEGIDDRKGMLSSILIGLMRDNGIFQLTGRVGGGFNEKQRKEIFDKLKQIEVNSEYIEVDSHHVPYKFVEPKYIVEIGFIDAITENSNEQSFLRMNLSYENNTYKIIRRMPFVSLISPNFIRFRDDKEAVPSDLRISQISDLVPIKDADKSIEKTKLPDEEIISRQVYSKILKGKTAVRKIIVWKTNKEEIDPNYPAYVLNYIDFSPERSEPLKREVRISNDKKQIIEIADQYREENIKKGWNKA